MENLTLKKGGKLTKTEWVYDKEKECGEYVTTPINEPSFAYLNDTCVLDDDVTLRDVLLLLQKDITFYSIMLRNWVDELVDEGLNKTPEERGDIDYLELYWHLEKTTYKDKTSFSGHQFPGFHGWGDWDDASLASGIKGGIAVEMTPVNELVDLPLRLQHDVAINHTNLDAKWSSIEELQAQQDEPVKIDECSYTLYHILYGIVWELSFCGSPKDRDEKLSELKDMIKDIKDGNIETSPVGLEEI